MLFRKHSRAYSRRCPSISSTILPHLFWPRFLRCPARFCSRVSAPVVEVSSDVYVEAGDISWMIMGEFNGKRDQTSRPRKRRSTTGEEHRETRAQALGLRELFPLSSTSKTHFFDNQRLREKLEAVPRLVLRSYLRSLNMDTSDEGLSSSSGPGSTEASVRRSSGRHQDVDLRTLKPARKSTRRSLHSLTTPSSQSFLSIASAPFLHRTIPSPVSLFSSSLFCRQVEPG